jgi:hypothetical protein
MAAYQFYWRDEKEKMHFIGILQERRKNPGRIIPESIRNGGGRLSAIVQIPMIFISFR